MKVQTIEPLDPASIAQGFGDLPTLAPVAVEVLRLADDDRATLEDIAKAISHDPALAAQMLKVANSPMYGMGGEVSSLSRAASILGLRTVKLLSLSFAVVTNSGGSERDAMIWRRTLAGSALGQTIADRFDRRLVDETFIAALLANIGRLALIDNPSYAEALDKAGGWLDTSEEIKLFGTSGDEVTALILESWGLPTILADAVRHRNEPARAEGTAARLAEFLHAADHASAFIVTDENRGPAKLDAWRVTADRLLGQTQEEADELLAASDEALRAVADLFNAEAACDRPVADLLQQARQGLARLSLDVVAALSVEQSRADDLAHENERLSAVAMTDPLTGMANRRAFDQRFDADIAAHDRGSASGYLGVMVIDLDHFKAVNDTHGHHVGDEVLQEVAQRLMNRCRSNEFVARMGGEEFGVIIPSTDPEEIVRAGDGYRKAVASSPIETTAGRLDVTASIGVATTDSVAHDTAAALYEQADRALYDAKKAGRNQVCSADR